MGKNIALFIDGTWNKAVVGKPENTNVYKLHENCLEPSNQKKYLPGVGTDWRHMISGGLFGAGMKELIREAYVFLSSTYERGDHIFLFGFSRGAFAARSLAGFVDKVGLLLKEDGLDHLDEAYALYEHKPQHEQLQLRSFLRRVTAVPAPAPEVTDLPIHFIGVWDTVAALGLPGRSRKYSAPFTEYHQTELPSNITHARHALALHELREPFEPLLWMGPSPRTTSLKQVWFPGAHGDVGGGYKKTDWSNEALRWMAVEAGGLGLNLCNARLPEPIEGYTAAIHHAIRGLFVGFKPTIRTVLADRLDLTQSAVDSFSIPACTGQRLLDPRARHYKFWRPCVNKTLCKIDDESLQLLLEIKFRQPGKRSAEWWTSASVAEVGAARLATTAFIRAYPSLAAEPSESEWDEFIQSLCLRILCDDKPLEEFQQTIDDIIKSGHVLCVPNSGMPDRLRSSLTRQIDTKLSPEWLSSERNQVKGACEMMLCQRQSLLSELAQAKIEVFKSQWPKPPDPIRPKP